MKILFIVPYVPDLIRVRSFNLIRTLAARGHKITLFTLYTNAKEQKAAEELGQLVEAVHSWPLPRWRSLYNCLLALPTRQPLQAWYCWQPKMAQQLHAILDQNIHRDGFDVIHVEHLRGVRYALEALHWRESNLQDKRRLPPIVWDSVDNISLLFRQSSSQSRRPLYRWLTLFELKRTERFEAHLLGKFAKILVTSPNDKQAFLSFVDSDPASARLEVLRNGVDLEYFHPDKKVERAEDTIVVSGKMSYHANVTMVMYLVDQIMPVVWGERPKTRLIVVGKDPDKKILALANHPNITITGTVQDIRPYIQSAAVAVAPLVYGAGIQNKVLESMACATPVVATPQAVSALQATPGREIIVADGTNSFAANVLGLLDQADKRTAIGAAGRTYVETYHDWNKIALQLEGVYDAVN